MCYKLVLRKVVYIKMSKILQVFQKNKVFLLNSLISFCILLLLFLAYYPGIITYDGAYQWSQVQSKVINNAHPFFSTYFMYILSKLYNSTDIIILFQITLFSTMWGYLCQLLKCSEKSNYLKVIFTIIISILPIISVYSITLWKDVLYSYYLFGISVLIFKGFIKEYKIFDYILLGILLSMVFSYRHNGMIVAILLLIIIIKWVIKSENKRLKIRNCIITMLTFIFILGIISVPKSIYLKRLPKNNDISLSTIETYALWDFGAYILNEKTLTANEKKFLNNIIPLKKWKKIYDPYIVNSTATEDTLDKKYLKKNNTKFLNIFVRNVKKNPIILIRHYLKADGLIINPLSMKDGYLYIFDFSEWGPVGFDAKIDSKLPIFKNLYNIVINVTFIKPFNYLYQPALWLYISIILCFVLTKIYGKKIWLFITPMLCNSISLLPINLAQDLRYVYINFPTAFAIILLFMLSYKKKKERMEIHEK